ncbi:MAG: hypothetical protein JO157_05000 [Acetobacteraceae bacterium]|nr:hypothetical protein [Acetobacteraceae bacterium]
MVLPPAVVVHGLADARLALAAGRPLTLLSAPGAAGYAGCGWWRAVIAAAHAETPGVSPEGEPGRIWAPDVLDCLNQTGRAIEALRYGLRRLVLLPGAPARDDVAARAEVLGATLLDARPPALDLARPGAARHLEAWLGSSLP